MKYFITIFIITIFVIIMIPSKLYETENNQESLIYEDYTTEDIFSYNNTIIEEPLNIKIVKETLDNNINSKIEEEDIYTTTYVNIRISPSIDSEILLTTLPNTKLIKINKYDDYWNIILIEGQEYYIADEYVTKIIPSSIAIDVLEQIERLKIKQSDLRYLASIIYAEAGNQCEAGQQAVGIVVMNRVKSSKFENSIYNVIYQEGQFQPTRNGSFNVALIKYDNGEIPESCIKAAEYALQGNTSICYNDKIYDMADYLFFARSINNCRLQIEDHMFK